MNRFLQCATMSALLGALLFVAPAPGEEPKPEVKKAETKKKSAKARAMAGIFKAASGAAADASGAAGDSSAAQKAENEAFLAQMLVLYRPALISELELLRSVCDLTPEQRPKIKAKGEEILKQSIASQGGQNRQGFVQFNGNSDVVLKSIRTSFQAALVDLLTPEQMAIFAKQCELRTARRKRATILVVVARLDAALYLSTEQRDKISAALSTAEEDAWETWSGISNYQGNYAPNLPDDSVVPHLNADQAEVWRGMQKISNGRNMMFGQGEAVEIDEWWENVTIAPAGAAVVDRPAEVDGGVPVLPPPAR